MCLGCKNKRGAFKEKPKQHLPGSSEANAPHGSLSPEMQPHAPESRDALLGAAKETLMVSQELPRSAAHVQPVRLGSRQWKSYYSNS